MTRRFSCMSQLVAGALVLVLFPGCASIIGKSGPESLNVRSTPDQARVIINDEAGTKIFEGKTPTVLSLEKKKGYFSGKKYNVMISKDGFKDRSVVVDTQVGGWYLGGNLIFGGLIGWLIVDPATGAMWTLNTNEINETLESASTPSAAQPAPQVPVSAPAPQASPLPEAPAAPQATPPTQTQMIQPNTAVVVLLQDVPESMRSRMIPVSR